MKPNANKLILSLLLALSVGSLYPYYQSINSRSLIGDFIIGLILWGAIKSLQLRPSIVADGSVQYLVTLAALAVDGAIVHHCWRSMTLSNLLMSGASLLAPLLSMRAARRIGVVRADAVTMPSVAHSQAVVRTVFQPNDSGVVAHPRSVSYTPVPAWDFITNTTDKIGNRFVFGLPGCGKGMTMAHWLRTIKAKFDVTIVYIDPKAKPEERGYFEGIVDVYHAARISRMEPGEAIEFIKAGLNIYEQICDSKQSQFTLLVLDEGTSIGKLFNSERNNYLDRRLTDYVSGGDGDGCNIWFVSQSPFMDDLGVKSGVATQLLKLVIAREEDLESLKSWGNSVLMRGIDIDKARSAIKNSPVGRSVFYGGKAAGWYPMPKLENFSDVDRDARSFNAPTAAHNVEVSATAAAFTAAESLDLAALDYFAAADPGRPKTVKNLRDSSRLRDRATSKELEDSLDRLTATGQLIRLPEGWALPGWIDNN
jgi:hypothetical protein